MYSVSEGCAREQKSRSVAMPRFITINVATGESIGQVSSQIPKNLKSLSYGINTPLFRPLIGFDKEETIIINFVFLYFYYFVQYFL